MTQLVIHGTEALSSGAGQQRPGTGTAENRSRKDQQVESFFREYTSAAAIAKYSRGTAGQGIRYLLDHDYKEIYLDALRLLPAEIQPEGIRLIEFGCGAGMNLLHLISVLSRQAMRISTAIGTDFSPVLIETAKGEAKNYLRKADFSALQFHIARNERLISDLSASTGKTRSSLENSFHFILGVNTIRYCYAINKELDIARDIFRLLVPGGVCVIIDMNSRFPFFRSDLKNRFHWKKEPQCYVPSLEEYTAPFGKAGFEVVRSEHFCWVPHSAGEFMTRLLNRMSPALDRLAKCRAMRSLVVSRKPTAIS
jgi:SAM-dependent methyltransferase